LGVPTAASADGGDAGSGVDELLISIANLTGPLAARESAEVAQEEQHLGLVYPQVPEPLLGAVGVDESMGCEERHVERHSPVFSL
jgi:hypothetical protein